ncbi:MAG TPA: hypothetical protein VM911_12645 [Pyrinomonadaceae bacterium]|jgi:hypothetical protein|nr:hypothetical protein [Pyrinomonadaceae bacterium]
MKRVKSFRALLLVLVSLWGAAGASAQTAPDETETEFGPVVRAYLGYLRNEQEVVDDRASRHEVNRAYYRRNSNRIRALRQMAVQIATETGNDYLPELEAATRDELKNLFEDPPRPGTFQVGDVLHNTFRFLGVVRAGEIFYLFARLDPYEQAELMQKEKEKAQGGSDASQATKRATTTTTTTSTASQGSAAETTRPRRANASTTNSSVP